MASRLTNRTTLPPLTTTVGTVPSRYAGMGGDLGAMTSMSYKTGNRKTNTKFDLSVGSTKTGKPMGYANVEYTGMKQKSTSASPRGTVGGGVSLTPSSGVSFGAYGGAKFEFGRATGRYGELRSGKGKASVMPYGSVGASIKGRGQTDVTGNVNEVAPESRPKTYNFSYGVKGEAEYKPKFSKNTSIVAKADINLNPVSGKEVDEYVTVDQQTGDRKGGSGGVKFKPNISGEVGVRVKLPTPKKPTLPKFTMPEINRAPITTTLSTPTYDSAFTFTKEGPKPKPKTKLYW